MNNNKIYEVYYYNNYDGTETLGLFSTEDKARQFIEDCKKVFYRQADRVTYDYRDLKLYISEWELDEWTDIIR
ncbi:hypothetical protein [Bacillus phage phiAGATE]|uniref:DUF7336 domain-containing protein n=1 Tax=Bacillus phage phiAGATE TaxID=1204533 RepID=L0L8D5_9CAUD|nr:hypothetical protein G380_gp009 [Bacillus phage phiAGATE]AGB62659.1 hypothetical protein [Bacillus phage phiAGATE]